MNHICEIIGQLTDLCEPFPFSLAAAVRFMSAYQDKVDALCETRLVGENYICRIYVKSRASRTGWVEWVSCTSFSPYDAMWQAYYTDVAKRQGLLPQEPEDLQRLKALLRRARQHIAGDDTATASLLAEIDSALAGDVTDAGI